VLDERRRVVAEANAKLHEAKPTAAPSPVAPSPVPTPALAPVPSAPKIGANIPLRALPPFRPPIVGGAPVPPKANPIVLNEPVIGGPARGNAQPSPRDRGPLQGGGGGVKNGMALPSPREGPRGAAQDNRVRGVNVAELERIRAEAKRNGLALAGLRPRLAPSPSPRQGPSPSPRQAPAAAVPSELERIRSEAKLRAEQQEQDRARVDRRALVMAQEKGKRLLEKEKEKNERGVGRELVAGGLAQAPLERERAEKKEGERKQNDGANAAGAGVGARADDEAERKAYALERLERERQEKRAKFEQERLLRDRLYQEKLKGGAALRPNGGIGGAVEQTEAEAVLDTPVSAVAPSVDNGRRARDG